MKKFSFTVAAAAMSLACASQAGAMTLTFGSGVSDQSSSSIASCFSPFTNQAYQNCATAGFVSDNVASSTDYFMNLDSFGGGGQGLGEESFSSAFSNALGSGWTLDQGDMSVMAGITMTVSRVQHRILQCDWRYRSGPGPRHHCPAERHRHSQSVSGQPACLDSGSGNQLQAGCGSGRVLHSDDLQHARRRDVQQFLGLQPGAEWIACKCTRQWLEWLLRSDLSFPVLEPPVL